MVINTCFHSLPTGKSFRTLGTRDYPSKIAKFPFPSNGKVLSDPPLTEQTVITTRTFPFPSNGKVLSDGVLCVLPIRLKLRFHSLPTGKSFRTNNDWRGNSNYRICFHSLPTGKSFRTLTFSTKKGEKRCKFPFPSNGKVLSDIRQHLQNHSRHLVSIPFQRESPFGQAEELLHKTIPECFHSLPTGKSFRTTVFFIKPNGYTWFPFPSNGKVLSDLILSALLVFGFLSVSIPFQRESPFGRFPPISAQSSRGSAEPKPNANCAGLFFGKNFT